MSKFSGSKRRPSQRSSPSVGWPSLPHVDGARGDRSCWPWRTRSGTGTGSAGPRGSKLPCIRLPQMPQQTRPPSESVGPPDGRGRFIDRRTDGAEGPSAPLHRGEVLRGRQGPRGSARGRPPTSLRSFRRHLGPVARGGVVLSRAAPRRGAACSRPPCLRSEGSSESSAGRASTMSECLDDDCGRERGRWGRGCGRG